MIQASRYRMELESLDGRAQSPDRAPALAASWHLSLLDHDGDVDRAPDHRQRALFRHAASGLVAACRFELGQAIRYRERLLRLLVRPACAVWLHLGASAPYARRHTSFYLGHGARPRAG